VSAGGPGGGQLTQVLTTLGLAPLVGQSPELILTKVADSIAPAGATNDEAIARAAILTTLDRLYTSILENGGDLSSLEALTPAQIKEVMIDYVSCYIYMKWVYELGIAVEKNTVTERQAIEMEAEMKDFVKDAVIAEFATATIRDLDLTSENNQTIIEDIFQLAYSTLEK
jgi:hypothetical protein